MKELTTKDIIKLGMEMRAARAEVLYRNGFDVIEISQVLGMPESVVRRIVLQQENV